MRRFTHRTDNTRLPHARSGQRPGLRQLAALAVAAATVAALASCDQRPDQAATAPGAQPPPKATE
ncbi:hypothetical protein ACH4E7_41480 [Kitasatospora sp. NPDC018058]|uniref:hypothetical protein n=1 Tax=Kitasatospora sp. NPDC018058 TaxID=3364025 RepID=UPI0037C03E53